MVVFSMSMFPVAKALVVTSITIVYVTDTGTKYHRKGCPNLKTSNPMSLRVAESKGYTPCSICHPDTETGVYTVQAKATPAGLEVEIEDESLDQETTKSSGRHATISFVLLCVGICYVVINGRWKKYGEREKFKGEVAGVCAGLALSDVCWDFTANRIYHYAMKEYQRCRSLDKNRPDLASDPIYYASFRDFAKFAMLCAIKYAETEGSASNDAAAILEYCQSKLIYAGNLTGVCRDWD